jgi:antitoxin component YwqK of YwqJK toxin-antitoxin module
MKIILTEQQFNSLLLGEGSVKSSESIKIYDDNEWSVRTPLSHNASCKYLNKSSLCIAAVSSPGLFNGYNKQGKFMIFINKNTNRKFTYYKNLGSFNDFEGWYDEYNNKNISGIKKGDPIKEKNPFKIPDDILNSAFKTFFAFINDKQEFKIINGDKIQINQLNNDGLMEGYWEIYHNHSNKVSSKGIYINDKKEGYWESYYGNGQLKERGSFKDGNIEGYWESYYDNGQLKEKGSFKDGKKEGYWEKYRINGKLEFKGNYTNDKREGIWEYYGYDGELERWVEFKKDVVVDYKDKSLKRNSNVQKITITNIDDLNKIQPYLEDTAFSGKFFKPYIEQHNLINVYIKGNNKIFNFVGNNNFFDKNDKMINNVKSEDDVFEYLDSTP